MLFKVSVDSPIRCMRVDSSKTHNASCKKLKKATLPSSLIRLFKRKLKPLNQQGGLQQRAHTRGQLAHKVGDNQSQVRTSQDSLRRARISVSTASLETTSTSCEASRRMEEDNVRESLLLYSSPAAHTEKSRVTRRCYRTSQHLPTPMNW